MTYHLEKYKGSGSRHTCPKCGKSKCFTYYVDENGKPLDKSVGRCDHESGCGYHYPPREYFEEHPAENKPFTPCREWKPVLSAKSIDRPIDTIPEEYVSHSRSDDSHLAQYLLSFHSGDKEMENVTKRVLDMYRLGTTKSGDTIFWQIDKENRVRTGKIIPYNKENGHRIKEKGVNWVHSVLKKQGVVNTGWTLCQCLFGEHLLAEPAGKRKVVAVVESEKTAVVCAVQYPDCIWLATGGKSQLSIDKMKVLADRIVIFFPDADGYHEWEERTKAFTFCRSVKVSDLLERNATDSDKEAKIDIADLILREWERQKLLRENNPLGRQMRTLRMMVEKNPTLQSLIDSFGLVPVTDDG